MDYLVKVGVFAFWLGLLYFIINYFISTLSFQIPAYCSLQIFDIPKILNFILSSYISCFIAKKILQFWQSA